jgi:hypothetical protein
MMPMDRSVLTTEFKINLLAPATGELIALLTATFMAVEGREGIAD